MPAARNGGFDRLLRRIERLHFVGIAGEGMSGIAKVMLQMGYAISGSDLRRTESTRKLESKGARIFEGHNRANITDADIVIYSSAVGPSNPEIAEARKRGIQILHRAEMLNLLMEGKKSIGVAGAHGKTTVSAILALMLVEGGFDPTFVVGGKIKNFGTNARFGAKDWMVVEADEFERSFLKMHPTFGVITSIDLEHVDSFGDIDQIKGAFLDYTQGISKEGSVILCADDVHASDIASKIERKVVTYGLSEGCDFRAKGVRFGRFEADFDLEIRGRDLGGIHINQPGSHNVRNALGAAAAASEIGIGFDVIRNSLSGFEGVSRRFECKGQASGITVVDDYAHHPTEIRAALKCARDSGAKRVIAVFQPHLYSRTLALYRQFGRSFQDADVVVITDIYAAREEPKEGLSGRLIADSAESQGHPSVMYIEDKNSIPAELMEISKPGDIVITLGAGDIDSAAERFLSMLGKKTDE